MIKANNKINEKKIIVLFSAVSVLLHISFSFQTVEWGNITEFLAEKPEEKRIFIKLQNRKPKQIVQTINSNNKQPVKPNYLSEKNNAYDRQTRSKFIDKFQVAEKGVRNAQKKERKKVNKKTMAKKLKDLKFSDLAVKSHENIKVKRDKKVAKTNSQKLGLKSGKTTGKGLGASSDFLENIPLGDFTKLNTQEYEYYGFYHRIRQKLEQFWGRNIQEQANKIYKQGRSIASATNLITNVVIKLDSEGKIVNIILKSTSGVKELDDAAIESFNQAGPFPNPPKGMLKADGKAVVEWGFVVNT
ncbi:MAG: hypothetical protein CME62_16565 [Halobacteriovoraceae bacterium]|nr:hypothetical protein [Halobacteriovoraceae bacterium]|tara:strand:- start:368 stop:1270 length:903 start_codon:yes stop_codon:yes gene_type:complete